MHQEWLNALQEVGEAVKRLGGDIAFMNGDGKRFPEKEKVGNPGFFARLLQPKAPAQFEFRGGFPLNPLQFELISTVFGGVIPLEIRRLLEEVGTKGFYSWNLPKTFVMPQEFEESCWGCLEWYFDEGIAANENRRGLTESVFPDPQSEYDKPWHTSIGILAAANGDIWAMDTNPDTYGRIIYLDHEGGEEHGAVLGPDMATVMDNWTRLGCVGPEYWTLRPFLHPTHGIDGFGDAARRFRKVLLLPD